MCIIAIKKAGVAIPGEELFEQMFSNNPDGAGMMWVENGSVRIAKGYMTFGAFKDALDKVAARLNLVGIPMVFHFRITTHGSTKPDNCHPFPISENACMLQKLQCTTNVGVAHNGMITNIAASKNGLSDTMEFVLSYLSKMKQISGKFYQHPAFKEIIGNIIGSDKMVFLDKNGVIETVGDFVTETDGMLYSNTSYMQSRWASYSWGWDDRKVCDVADLNGYVRVGDALDGTIIDDYGMFYIDAKNTLYFYDVELDVIVPLTKDSAEAYGADGQPLQYKKAYAIIMPYDDFAGVSCGTCAYCKSVLPNYSLNATEIGSLCDDCLGTLESGA